MARTRSSKLSHSILGLVIWISFTSLLNADISSNSTLPSPSPPLVGKELQVARTNCTKQRLTQTLWNKLDLDDYMKKFEGGKTLSLVAYADQVNMTNFVCGIGAPCDAGQLCSSAMPPDWYILVGTQNWNQLMNDLYTSLAYGFGTVQDIAPSMITDLVPERTNLPVESATWLGMVAAVSGTFPAIMFPGVGLWVWVWLQGILYTTASEIWFYQNVIRAPPDVVSGYTKWTNFAWMLANMQDKAQEKISNYTQNVLKAGISQEDGMFGVLKGGKFLERPLKRPQFEIQTSFENIVRLKLLAAILRSQNVYITRGSDPCTYSGPAGAFNKSGVLSYCGKDHVMMNIVQAKGSHTKMKLFGAGLIESKYGFTTGFLTNAAWNCQVKYGRYGYDPYSNTTLPSDVNSDCLFNLPVCDCTSKEISQKRAKGMRTTKACHEAGVPIYHNDSL
ncbi:hypothetical protein CROQUDRAFT_61356 [Cronartium quercuum f. sp. fusiforme G11]|uniref:DUF7872 domain-containing protein n=1 Tax=Cronartium quercuum f. sp. fusiforme G11 TaxID=708437 RepID=A0A9P6NP76_9BASI|nr:hypothetical protein CROQUDRAFT_61356 [Cronartium quercuum f. sp. fusiforme G11]